MIYIFAVKTSISPYNFLLSLQIVTVAMQLKDVCSLEGKLR